MELFSPIKILSLLICFEMIFSKMNVNKSSEIENYSQKTMTEFTPISYLSQATNAKFTESDYSVLKNFTIDVPVKYVYIDNYDIYDISGLLKKSSREDADYTATLNSVKIIYNFKDLKKTDECNFEGKQIFGISDKCQPLAGEMGKGNTWNINFDSDGKKLIQIKLNPENENIHVKYLLKCSQLKNYDINEEKSSLYDTQGTTNLVLYIETIYACPTFDKFVLWEWIEYFHYFLGVLFIILGLVTLLSCTPEFSTLFMFYLILYISIVSIVKTFFPPAFRFWKIWLILIACVIFSGLLLFVLYKAINAINANYFKYPIGVFLGFFVGQYFYDLFVEIIVFNSLFFYLLFIILFIIGGVVLSYFSLYTTIYLTSSFFGAYIILRGISMFGGEFPSEYIIVLLKTNGEVGQIEKLITWRFYVYNCSAFALGAITFFLQFRSRKDVWNHELEF